MLTVLSNSWKPLKNPITLMILTTLIKLPMVPCLPMLLLIRLSSKCTLMDISVTLTSLALSQMGLALFVISLSITKTFWMLILISLWRKNRILQTRISHLPTQKHYFLFWSISSRNIPLLIQRLFWAMQPLIRLKSTNLFLKKSDFKKLSFLLE